MTRAAAILAVILALVTAQRLFELRRAGRNTRALRAAGAVEAAPGHYPLIVALHAAWLGGLWLTALAFPSRVGPPAAGWLILFAALQGLRLWVLATLKNRWTTRIIVLPGAPLVRGGPYRFIAHPNYLAVVGEIAALPLAFGLVWYALGFSLANAAILAVRIRAENAALAGH